MPSETPTSPPAPGQRPKTYWWVVSLLAPLLGLALAILEGFGVVPEPFGFVAFLVSAVVGLWMCVRSIRRREYLCLNSLISGIPCGYAVIALLVRLVLALVNGTSARHF